MYLRPSGAALRRVVQSRAALSALLLCPLVLLTAVPVEASDRRSSDRESRSSTENTASGACSRDYQLAYEVIGEGSVSYDRSDQCYNHGDTVTMTATAADGWSFSHWAGDGGFTSTANPLRDTVTAAWNTRAIFTEGSSAPSPPPATTAPGEWPGPSTTGVPAGTRLSPSGSIRTERDGQVIDGLEVSGTIEVRHSNVTIRNTRVLASGLYGIFIPHNLGGSVRNLLIEDVELRGIAGQRSSGLVHFGDWTARRIQISGFEDAVKISHQTLEDSWIRNDYYAPPGSHNDGIQSVGGSGAVIRGNRIEGPSGQTSALIVQSNVAPVRDYLIEDNLISGGNYSLYIRDKGAGFGVPSDMTIRNNVWVRDSWTFGPTSIQRGPGFVWTGNTLDDGSVLDR